MTPSAAFHAPASCEMGFPSSPPRSFACAGGVLWLVTALAGHGNGGLLSPQSPPPLPPPSQPLRRAKYCFHIYLKSSFLNSLAFHIELVIECDECPLDGFALAVLLLDEESQWPLPGPLCFSNNRTVWGGGGSTQARSKVLQ